MKAPPRLLDDPATAPELRRDLKRSTTALCAYDAAAGLAGLQVAIGSSLIAPAGSTAAAHATASIKATATAGKSAALLGSAGVKLALATVGTAAAVAAAVATWPQAPAEPAATPRAPAAHVAATPHPTKAQPEIARVPDPTSDAPVQAVVPATEPSAALSAPSAPTRAPRLESRVIPDGVDPALRREIAQLGHIKTLLERDPAAAYRLAQAGHREFKRGMLRQEREGLAVLALFSLNHRAAAEARAHAFVAQYPTSPLREQLERLLSGKAQ